MSLYLPVAWLTFMVSGFFVSFTYYDLPYILGALTAGLYASVDEKLHRGSSAAPPSSGLPVPTPRYRGGLPPAGVALRFRP